MRNTVLAAAMSMLVVACAPYQPSTATSSAQGPRAVGEIPGLTWSSHTVVYQCQSGTKLQVAYLNMKSGESFAALHFNGNTSLLQSRQMASGVRYIALDEQNSLRWTTKGDTGFLSFMAADHTAQEQTLLADCKAQS